MFLPRLRDGARSGGDGGHGARKVVTILFTDVTGPTSLGERLDPESLRGVMGQTPD